MHQLQKNTAWKPFFNLRRIDKGDAFWKGHSELLLHHRKVGTWNVLFLSEEGVDVNSQHKNL